jgi:hypothetical protein
LRRLQAPDEQWQEILAERLEILNQWWRVLSVPSAQDERAYTALGEREEALRSRVHGLRSTGQQAYRTPR